MYVCVGTESGRRSCGESDMLVLAVDESAVRVGSCTCFCGHAFATTFLFIGGEGRVEYRD